MFASRLSILQNLMQRMISSHCTTISMMTLNNCHPTVTKSSLTLFYYFGRAPTSAILIILDRFNENMSINFNGYAILSINGMSTLFRIYRRYIKFHFRRYMTSVPVFLILILYALY